MLCSLDSALTCFDNDVISTFSSRGEVHTLPQFQETTFLLFLTKIQGGWQTLEKHEEMTFFASNLKSGVGGGNGPIGPIGPTGFIAPPTHKLGPAHGVRPEVRLEMPEEIINISIKGPREYLIMNSFHGFLLLMSRR